MEGKKKGRGNFLYLLTEAWQYKRVLYLYFVLNIVVMLILSAAGIMTPRYLIAELTGEARVRDVIGIAAAFFVVTAAAGYASACVKAGYEMDISRFRYYFISRMKVKIMRVRYEKLEDPKYLNEFWRVTSATSDIEFGVQGILTQLFLVSANSVSAMFYLSILGRLNILIVLLLIGNIYLVYLLRGKAGKYEVETSKKASSFGRRQRYLTNVMGNLAYGKDIRIYGLSNILLDKLMLNHQSRRTVDIDIQRHHYGADLAESILSCIRDSMIYGYLIISVLEGRISIADFTMCFMTVAVLTIILEKVFEDVAFIKSDLFRIDEMRTFLDLPNEEDGGPEETVPVPQAEHYEIAFRHVSFHYPGTDQNVYTDFNFTMKAGKKLAIVGINGAGKTTLVKLITRLYDPTEGEILLNGIDIRRFVLSDYRNLLAAVFQDINLFAMSLQENITCREGGADEERLQAAIGEAGLTAFYEQHGKNPDLQLTKYLYHDGVDVSGGERQKIGIARALYKNGKILIFDEPTAALDAHAEYTLYHELAEISKDRTLLFISHRLASTRFCDEIALIDGGCVAELGTHEELLEKRGKYYQMFMAQKKYYEEGEAPHEA
ncbi:MAG: ABC transporter ATP-binding protein/permease [Clostridiales bacterium]|nr:ABC transporter ATP-binding protein/permease [Clostridiales bacterium]